MKIKIIQNNITTEREYRAPALISDVIKQAGAPFGFPCGGHGGCGKCLVSVNGEEKLACQTPASTDATVILPDSRAESILTSGVMPDFAREPWGDGLGAAIDVGTTTVAAYLYDLESGALLSECSAPNPQRAFGADVISRMERSIAGDGDVLRRLITDCINALIVELCAAAAADTAAVTSAVITGNTAMLCFLCGEPVQCLAGLPFIPNRYFGEFLSPKQLNLSLPDKARVYLPRCVSAYVGADITSGIIAAGLNDSPRPVLLVDIGTNGEMVLQTGGRLLACSTAAGPAFEGAGIKMGGGAVSGAVRSVTALNGVLYYETIGGTKPESICSSGIVDAVAVLLELGALEDSGRIDAERASELGLLRELDGEPALKIAGDVALTQRDIRAVQLAKAAICAGMRTLLLRGGVTAYDLETLYIAGGFGSYMNPRSAAAIGLIIPELAATAKSVGNSAGSGAAMLLQSEPLLEVSENAAKQAETIELATDKFFRESYIDCMSFERGGKL
jgi:uncharacterized 2Fe-2S/4Fe-4S cluster protein (DUF4445 family)